MGSVTKAGSWEDSRDFQQLISGFHELKVSQRTPVIELKSNYGLSALRDVQSVAGSATIGNNGSEHTLSTGTTIDSVAILSSAERGRYMPGAQAEAGIGVRLNHTFISDQKAEWGYFDDDNGFGFGKDKDGVYVFTLRSGTYSKTYQNNWSADTLTGDGGLKNPSNLSFNTAKGNIYQIDFSYYGYGTAEFKITVADKHNKQVNIPVHRFSPSQETSVVDPNLPLRASVDNGSTSTDIDMFVGGRQFSTFLPYMPNRRVIGQRRLSLGSIGTTFLPLVTFRKKTAFNTVSVKIQGMDIISDQDLVYEIRLSATLAGESYGTPTNTSASETACEADNSATSISGGEALYVGLLDSSGSGSNQSGSANANDLDFDVPGNEPVTLCVRTVSGTGATASCVFRWREEW